MKFIDFRHWWDFGQEFRLTLLRFKRFSVFNMDIHHSDYFDWKEVRIYVSVSILGRCNLFALTLNAWNITIDLSLFELYF
jgi:hypothetical protein